MTSPSFSSEEPPSLKPPVSSQSGSGSGAANGSNRNCLLILGIVVGITLILTLIGTLVYFYYFHARINPTELSDRERAVAEKKLELVDAADGKPGEAVFLEPRGFEVLPPEDQEELAKLQEMERRTVSLSEREINGLLNYNTDLGQHLKFHFDTGRIRMETIIPTEPDMPVVGGKEIRASVDISVDKAEAGDLVIAISDVTVGGVPMPNAWLGGVKGQNLMQQIDQETGFLRAFSDGIEEIIIQNGEIRVRLAE